MVSQTIVNLVDTAMVGVLGDAALRQRTPAGSRTGSRWRSSRASRPACRRRRRGTEREHAEQAVPLNGGLLQAVALALPLSALVYALTPQLFPLLIDDPEVIELGVPYLRTRLCAMAFVAMNFAFRGYFNGVSLSRLYMSTLIVMHVSNVALNWVLIFGNLGAPAMGVRGAAMASSISAAIGTLTYVALAYKHPALAASSGARCGR